MPMDSRFERYEYVIVSYALAFLTGYLVGKEVIKMTVLAGLGFLALVVAALVYAGLFLFRRNEVGERQVKYGRRFLACVTLAVALLALLVLLG